MGKIKKISEKESANSAQRIDIYPITSTKAVYDTNNKVLDDYIQHLKKTSTFAGIATPTTNPGTPDSPVFYIATTAGTYTNFSGIKITEGEAVILEWKGSWVKKTTGFATQGKLTEIENNVGLYNVDKNIPLGSGYYTSTTARAAIPTAVRKLGLIITYKTDSTTSVTEQFTGSSISSWTTDTNWTNVGSAGGNMILDWDTDVATTRKQVLQKYRKQLLQISYKNANGDTVNEQYIGTLFTDTEWVKDNNWISIPNESQISKLSSNIIEIRKSLSNSSTFLFTIADCITVGILKKDGTVDESYTNAKVSDFVEIKGNWIIDAVYTYPIQGNYAGLLLFKEDKTTIVGVFGDTFKIDTKDYPEAKYVRYCLFQGRNSVITINQNLVELDKVQENVDSVSNILKLNDEEKYINVEIAKVGRTDFIGDIVGFNHPLDADSYLQSIYISETEKTFGDTALAYVGIIDQYNLFVVSKTVECTVTGIQFGSIILEPNSPCLINKGEIILVGVEKSRWGSGISRPEYGGYPVKVSKSTFMAEKLLNCPLIFVVNVRKIVYKDFVSKQEVDNINNEISAIKNQFILHDEGNGNNYKVMVYNGELKLKLLAYNKILCIGNSFTYSPKRSLWPEEGRNMLASVNSSQYVEMIKLAANAEKVDKLFARSFEYAANDTSIDTYNF